MDRLEYNRTLLNRSESRTKALIQPVLEMLGVEYSLLSQVAMSQIISPKQLQYRSYEWHICMTSSVDFLVVQGDQQEPILALEYDGPMHQEEKKRNKDRVKNELFQRARLPLVRIAWNDERKLAKPVDLCDVLTGHTQRAAFLQYAIWYLVVYHSMKRLVENLFEGTLEIPHFGGQYNRLVRSDELPVEEKLHFAQHCDLLRDGVLGSLAPADKIIYAFGENLEHEKEVYCCGDVEVFYLMFKVVPTFRFRRVHDGIHAEGLLGLDRFSNPAVRVTGFGFGQDILDNLALSYHVRSLLGRFGAVRHKRAEDADKRRVASMTASERQEHIERQRERSQQLVGRLGEWKERRKRREEQQEGGYGPGELHLFSDERLRQDLDKYRWNWERFMQASA